MSSKPTIFISYSHKDEEWKDHLITHLGVLQLQNALDFWTDDAIRIGDAWFQKIQDAMNAASVAVLLVSAHSLTSNFILREEIKRLLERREQEGLPIFPILVRQCAWRRVPWLAQMQMRPRNGVPLAAGTEYQIDDHLTAIVEEIQTALEQLVEASSSVQSQRPDETTVSPKKTEPPPSPSSPPPSLAPTFRNSIGMEFVLIPAGEFQMGGNDKEAYEDERPVHRVRITRSFYLGKYPVTQAQWETVMGNNPSRFTRNPNRPVEQVSWSEAQEFLRKLSEKEGGQPYRLSTEAEWEYAARAGSTARYCFGNDEEQLEQYAWYDKNAGSSTHPVGQLKPNTWGLYNVHGNVWEWVNDWFDETYYQKSPLEDPKGPETGEYRSMRGGSWGDGPRLLRVSSRRWNVPGYRNDFVGFRCAR